MVTGRRRRGGGRRTRVVGGLHGAGSPWYLSVALVRRWCLFSGASVGGVS
ncbi:Hypothetical protein EPM1_1331 [Stenotrophomonas maltophilia EPM1]|nr:Hypothetical protein EPM1_1331 [Stenotrophomonas maltophilia EPM1]